MNEELKNLMEDLNLQFKTFKTENDANNVESVKRLEDAMDLKQTQIDELKRTIARSNLETTIEEVKDVDSHAAAFELYARKGIDTDLLEFKAMNTGTPSDGGFLVPEIIQNGVLELMQELSPIRGIANVVSISGTGNFVKNVQDSSTVGGWVAENATRTLTAGATFGQINIPTFELYANPQVTNAMIEDSAISLESFLSSDIATTFATLENSGFVVGTGVTQPIGLDQSTGISAWDTIGQTVVASTSAVTGDDLLTLVYDLKPQYRANAKWTMNRNTLESIRKLKDSTGRYLFERGNLDNPSIIGTLLGYPVVENEAVPDMAANALAIYFGDFSRGYQIVDRTGISTLRNPYKTPGFVEFYTRKRLGGGLLDGNALRVIKMAAV